MSPLQGFLLQVQCGYSDKALWVNRRDSGFSVQIQSPSFLSAFLRITSRAWYSPEQGPTPRASASVWVKPKNLHFWQSVPCAFSLENHAFKTPVLGKVLTDPRHPKPQCSPRLTWLSTSFGRSFKDTFWFLMETEICLPSFSLFNQDILCVCVLSRSVMSDSLWPQGW